MCSAAGAGAWEVLSITSYVRTSVLYIHITLHASSSGVLGYYCHIQGITQDPPYIIMCYSMWLLCAPRMLAVHTHEASFNAGHHCSPGCLLAAFLTAIYLAFFCFFFVLPSLPFFLPPPAFFLPSPAAAFLAGAVALRWAPGLGSCATQLR